MDLERTPEAQRGFRAVTFDRNGAGMDEPTLLTRIIDTIHDDAAEAGIVEVPPNIQAEANFATEAVERLVEENAITPHFADTVLLGYVRRHLNG